MQSFLTVFIITTDESVPYFYTGFRKWEKSQSVIFTYLVLFDQQNRNKHTIILEQLEAIYSLFSIK